MPEFKRSDALVVVDVQNDFCPGGALAVEGGDRVVPVLNEWIEAARGVRAVVAASRDWHPHDHMSFEDRGGPWPRHCVRDTPGAAFHPDLRLPPDAWIISKGADRDREQYSAFDGTGLGDRLRERGVERVWIGGLALDVCVHASVLDARKEGFEVHLIEGAARPVKPDDGERALREMREAGAAIESGGSHG